MAGNDEALLSEDPGSQWPPGVAIVLGAGASSVAGAPAMAGFQSAAEDAYRALSRDKGQKHEAVHSFGRVLDAWKDLVPDANIEEFYILAEVYDKIQGVSLDFEVLDLQFLISETIRRELRGEESPSHQELVRRIGRKFGGRDAFSGIISLNWDLLVDNAAFDIDTVDLHYGYEPAELLGGDSSTMDGEEFELRLLKPHGSLNWLFCGNCGRLFYTAREKARWRVIQAGSEACSHCGGQLSALFIPPAAEKLSATSESPLAEIWGKTRALLTKCRSIFVIGYSFPKGDLQFRTLFQEAISSNPYLMNIEIVTSQKQGSQKIGFEDHYSQILSAAPPDTEINFKYSGFSRWIGGNRLAPYDTHHFHRIPGFRKRREYIGD